MTRKGISRTGRVHVQFRCMGLCERALQHCEPNKKIKKLSKATGPAGQHKMNCCGPNWPDDLKNASGPAGT